MYAHFFGLRELPFNNTPDPRFFYPTPDHDEALASLIYAVQERKGCVLLTGEVGAGKTLVARMMLRRFGPQLAYAAVNHGVHSAIDLMHSVCAEFELSFEQDMSPAQLVHILQDFLMERFARDIPVALVLDEAQSLPLDAFEQLRMIGNLEADDAKLLQVVIVGQPELQRRFATREFCQLKQRIFRSFHLPAMERKATEGYIKHRLSIAGPPSGDPFDESAIDTIYKFSQGLPRIINTLCDNAMLSAYSADRREMDGSFLESVIRQMMISPEPSKGSDYFQTVPEPPCASAVTVPVERRVVYESPLSVSGCHARETANVDWIARRVSEEVEARLGSRLAALGAPNARPQPSEGRDIPRADDDRHSFEKSLQSLTEQLTNLSRELAAQESKVDNRLTALEQRLDGRLATLEAHLDGRLATLEQRLDGAASPESQAQDAQAHLQPLLHRAGAIVEKAAAASHELERREVYLRTFSREVRSVLEEVHERLDSLNRTVARTRRAERGAEGMCSKLVAQFDRSRRIADNLKQILTRLASHSAALEAKQRIRRHTSAPAGGNGGITIGPASTPNGMQRMLGSARESVAELRTLIRQSADHPGRRLQPTQPPTSRPATRPAVNARLKRSEGRDMPTKTPVLSAAKGGVSPQPTVARTSPGLADEVEDLLEMVESPVRPSTNTKT